MFEGPYLFGNRGNLAVILASSVSQKLQFFFFYTKHLAGKFARLTRRHACLQLHEAEQTGNLKEKQNYKKCFGDYDFDS